MYELVRFLHVLGAFLFVAAHGASMIVAFRLRATQDRERVLELLQTSGAGIGVMYLGLLLLLAAGILAGFIGNHWGRGWIWAALGTLVVVIVVMYVVATPFYGRMRAAAGTPGWVEKADRYKPPAAPEQLSQLASSNRPFVLAAVGGIGLVVLLWLMLYKPF
jgi:Predicted integral membrane protein (DUF2269)